MQYLYNDGDRLHLHGRRHLRPDPGAPPTTVGDAANYLLENQDVIVARHEGNAAVHRAAGVGDARDHLHRARPAGRPLHRRHQAGDRRDRRRDPGAAVPRDRHQDQGRHPRRVATSAGSADPWPPAPRPASAPSTSSSRPSSAGSTPRDLLRERLAAPVTEAPPVRVHRRPRQGVVDHRGAARRAHRHLRPGLDARADAGRRPRDPAHRGLRGAVLRRRPRAGRHQRGGRAWRPSSPPTTARASSTGCWPGSSRSSRPSPDLPRFRGECRRPRTDRQDGAYRRGRTGTGATPGRTWSTRGARWAGWR